MTTPAAFVDMQMSFGEQPNPNPDPTKTKNHNQNHNSYHHQLARSRNSMALIHLSQRVWRYLSVKLCGHFL